MQDMNFRLHGNEEEKICGKSDTIIKVQIKKDCTITIQPADI